MPEDKRVPATQHQQPMKPSIAAAAREVSEKPPLSSSKMPVTSREEKTADQKKVEEEKRASQMQQQQQQQPKTSILPTSEQPSIVWIKVVGALGEGKEPPMIDREFLEQKLVPVVQQQEPMMPSSSDGDDGGQAKVHLFIYLRIYSFILSAREVDNM